MRQHEKDSRATQYMWQRELKGEGGRIRPTTGSKRRTTKLTRYADKSGAELNNALSRR